MSNKTQRTWDIKPIEAGITADLAKIKALLDELVGGGTISVDGAHMEAYAGLETFVAISLRIISKTTPSKVRSEAMNVEIEYRTKSTGTA